MKFWYDTDSTEWRELVPRQRIGDCSEIHVLCWGSCSSVVKSPRRPAGRRGFHTTAPKRKRAHLRVPANQNTTNIPREDPQREKKRHEKTPPEREKKTREDLQREKKRHEKIPREREKKNGNGSRRGKKARNFGLRAAALRAPTRPGLSRPGPNSVLTFKA